ncbi:uncharacterized protein EDB93DRAFT_1257539 [Suillus bovinus]|uniref:uncharacterized protein n=1 Tax=Suillus bovinus TaxID=48563 RepID=UPI001B85B7D1|nr:uncharacterized protein EDB93DRAFT_1257539 [Suillus bovinus]KAG2126370.1 hypothetical protein EDB93DRAFT_1257539 [Suillus bovinus]
MHTNAQPGINIDVAADLKANFAWAPLTPQTQNVDDDLAGPESISLDEINTAFALLEHDAMEQELHVDQGLAPKSVDNKIILVDHTSHNDGQWDVDVLMSSNVMLQEHLDAWAPTIFLLILLVSALASHPYPDLALVILVILAFPFTLYLSLQQSQYIWPDPFSDEAYPCSVPSVD